MFPLLPLLLLLTPTHLTAAQDLPTCTSTLVTSHITNTSTPHLHLSCSVPPAQLASGGWLWQWDKLADDPSSSHLPLQNATSFINGSTYRLPVECGASGQYQASYLSTGGDCVYSCQFFVEVVEVISEQILNVFQSFRKSYSIARAGNSFTKCSLTFKCCFWYSSDAAMHLTCFPLLYHPTATPFPPCSQPDLPPSPDTAQQPHQEPVLPPRHPQCPPGGVQRPLPPVLWLHPGRRPRLVQGRGTI